MKKIISVVGARPQFIKHAAVQLELQKHFQSLTIHTGQHYDTNMSAVFFEELKIDRPSFQLQLSNSSVEADQLLDMQQAIEEIFENEKPNLVIVYGDTNSTLAAVLAASKLNINIAHIEAGLRSYNSSMPEERNRIIADKKSHLLFCPTKNSVDNLHKENIKHNQIFVVGDVMLDTLNSVKKNMKQLYMFPYYFATLHRPYNVDDTNRLSKILMRFNALDHKVIFAVHPRTMQRIKDLNLSTANFQNIIFIPPTNYIESLSLQFYSKCVITDSGGMQKEAYFLRKKCITLRSETEWVETLENNWNTLVFENLDQIQSAILLEPKNYLENIYGDGFSANKIVTHLLDYIK